MNKFSSILIIAVFLVQGCKSDDNAPLPNSKEKTYTFTTIDSNWVYDNTDSSYNLNYGINEITEDVISNSIVEVYLSDSLGNWMILPNSLGDFDYSADYQLGEVSIQTKFSNGTNIFNHPSVENFKVVTIPDLHISQEDTNL